MKSASDVWICRNCRSINPLRSGRCYRCSTPIEVAAAKPEDLTVVAGEVSQAPVGTFRSSAPFAVAVSVLAVVFILTTLFALWTFVGISELKADGKVADADALLASRLSFLVMAPVMAVVAMLAYAAWIRQVIANLPTLGLGYSRVSPTLAFIEPLIPGFNFYALPARISEAVQKLGGHRSAMPLLGLAILLILVPSVIALWALRVTLVVGTIGEFLLSSAVAFLIVFAFMAIAIVIVVVVIWQVEGLSRQARQRLDEPSRRPIVNR